MYDALQERLKFLFEEFDNIFVSFSGGKDSGLLLNLTLDFQRKYYPHKKIGVFHQDFEAQYNVTTEYVERTFERIRHEVEPYWVCLPMATRMALSSYQMYWYPWDDTKKELWVRPMPNHPYVINLRNSVIDPEMWAKLVGRVQGAKISAPFTARPSPWGYRSLTLPEGHTWESYTKFLLDTLPPCLRNNYMQKFKTSIDFWHTTGGGLEESVIQELIDHGYNIRRNGVSNYTVMKYSRVIFLGKIPDHTDDIRSSKDISSWKRMCFCILKNDHTCRFMGFGLTREQQKKVDILRRKYSKIGDES